MSIQGFQIKFLQDESFFFFFNQSYHHLLSLLSFGLSFEGKYSGVVATETEKAKIHTEKKNFRLYEAPHPYLSYFDQLNSTPSINYTNFDQNGLGLRKTNHQKSCIQKVFCSHNAAFHGCTMLSLK